MSCKITLALAYMLICFTVLVFGPACDGKPIDKEVHTIQMTISASVNWDNDIEPDGVQLSLKPKDVDGWMVKDELMIDASLWSQPDFLKQEKGKLIQDWDNINFTRRSYDKDLGARIRLEYTDYTPSPLEFGILEVHVKTSDGKEFSFEQPSVQLGHSSGQIKQLTPSDCCPSGCF